MSEKKVSFSAADNGISSFIKKVQTDSKTLYSDIAKEAQKQTVNQKEQLKIIEAQIKSLERQNNLEKEQNKILLERKRSAGTISEKKYDIGISQMKEDASVNKLQTGILKDLLEEMKASNKEDVVPEQKKESTFNSVLLAGVVRDIFGLVRQTSTAQTGLDLLSPAAGIVGAATGTVAGSIAEAATAGQIEYATIGAQAGKDIGGFAGDIYTRHLRTRDQYDQQYDKFKASTGMGGGVSNLAGMGYDLPAVAAAMNQAAMASGTGRGARGKTDTMLGLSRGYGIDESTSLAAIGMQKSGGGNGVANMQRTLGIAIAEGLDRAKFSDVIKTQTTLMQQFAATSTNPSAQAANQMMFEYNRMGGAFKIGDPRSLGKITAMSEGMANPTTDFDKAMSYSILRELNPNSDVWDLVGKQEKAGEDPAYRKAFMDKAINMTGSTMINKLLLHGKSGFDMASGINKEDIDTLFAGQDSFGAKLSKGSLSSDTIKSEAEKFTSHLQKNQAEVTNAFVKGFMDGTIVVADQFVNEMRAATDKIAIYWENRILQSIGGKELDPKELERRRKEGWGPRKPDKSGKSLGMTAIWPEQI